MKRPEDTKVLTTKRNAGFADRSKLAALFAGVSLFLALSGCRASEASMGDSRAEALKGHRVDFCMSLMNRVCTSPEPADEAPVLGEEFLRTLCDRSAAAAGTNAFLFGQVLDSCERLLVAETECTAAYRRFRSNNVHTSLQSLPEKWQEAQPEACNIFDAIEFDATCSPSRRRPAGLVVPQDIRSEPAFSSRDAEWEDVAREYLTAPGIGPEGAVGLSDMLELWLSSSEQVLLPEDGLRWVLAAAPIYLRPDAVSGRSATEITKDVLNSLGIAWHEPIVVSPPAQPGTLVPWCDAQIRSLRLWTASAAAAALQEFKSQNRTGISDAAYWVESLLDSTVVVCAPETPWASNSEVQVDPKRLTLSANQLVDLPFLSAPHRSTRFYLANVGAVQISLSKKETNLADIRCDVEQTSDVSATPYDDPAHAYSTNTCTTDMDDQHTGIAVTVQPLSRILKNSTMLESSSANKILRYLESSRIALSTPAAGSVTQCALTATHHLETAWSVQWPSR